MASAATRILGAARAIKPTEVGDAAKQQNPDETQVNKGGCRIRGCPRRGDRCGDRVKDASIGGILVEKRSNFVQEAPPF